MQTLKNLLEGVLTQPTAPFRESWVKRACLSFCDDLKLPTWEDSTGNLWVGARSKSEATKTGLVFVAHMDHPGIVVKSFERRGKKIFAHGQWLGGGPMDIRNQEVKVFSDVNGLIALEGKVASFTKGARGPDVVKIEITPTPLAIAACTDQGFKSLGPWGACLWYSKKGVPKGVAFKNGEVVTKAADDLVGACGLIYALKQAGAPKGIAVLLTRAEESGFHGTIEVLRKKILNPLRTMMVSIETSSQLPLGGELGKGPVLRLGDKATVFDPGFTYWMQQQAAELAKREKKFTYQRRVMDGGTCEATAFNCYGFRVAGVSVPLKNYHNMSPSGRAEPESVSLRDVERLTLLVSHTMKSFKRAMCKSQRHDIFKSYLGKLIENQNEHMKYFKGI